MNICFHSFSNYVTNTLEKSILATLTIQQKKICIIASIALGFLAVCYLAGHYCTKMQSRHTSSLEEQKEILSFFEPRKEATEIVIEQDQDKIEEIYDPAESLPEDILMDIFHDKIEEVSSPKLNKKFLKKLQNLIFAEETTHDLALLEKNNNENAELDVNLLENLCVEKDIEPQVDLEKIGNLVENLPEDILICIFSLLDFISWNKLLYIKKQFHNICLHPTTLASLLNKDYLPHPVICSSTAKAKTMVLEFIERSTYRVEKLNLNSLNLTKEDLKKIISICSNLKELNLSFAKFSDLIEDEILKYLPSSLKSLILPTMTDNGLKHVNGLPNLHSLKLDFCHNITDTGLEHLKVLSALQDLTLHHSYISGEISHFDCDLNLICRKKITDITCNQQPIKPSACRNITDIGLKHLKIFSSLRSLTIYSGLLTDNGLEHLKAFSHLQYLNLSWCENISDNGLEHLKTLSNLRSLSLACTHITDNGLESLKALSGLQFLDLSACNITDNGLEHLKAFSALQFLRLSKCDQITDKGLEHLKTLSGLQFLGLHSCHKIANNGLQHLQALSALQSLNLSNTQITDKGLEYLKTLSALQSLELKYCSNITDIGLQCLQSHHKGISIRYNDY